MKITRLVAAVFAGAAFGVSAQTVFTSESAFVAALSAGYYQENFSGLTPFNGSPISSLSFGGGTPAVGYQISSGAGGLFINNDSGLNAVGNWVQSFDLTVTFTSPNVYAVGAGFYLNDINGVNQNGIISITFSDGTAGTAPSSASGPYGFFGVIAATPITSMTVSENAAGFLNMANLYTEASPVPEPATAGLVFLAGIFGLACVRKF